MASIKEAYDSTIGESFTGLKLLFWSIPLSYCREVIAGGSPTFISNCIIGIFLLLLIGFLAESANNAIEKKPTLIPGINLISMTINGIKTILAICVYAAIAYFGATYACSFINLESKVWTMTIHIMLWFFFLSIPVSAFMVYCRKLDLFSAFNLKKMIQISGDAFIIFSYLIVKLFLLSFIVIGFISYLFWLFVGLENALIGFIWSVAIMYNLVIGTNYIAQASEELFAFLEKQQKTEIMEGAKLY